MSRSLLYYIFSWFFLIFILLLGVRFLYTKLNNVSLRENFVPNKRYTQYLAGTPIEEIDFELLHQRFHYASAASVPWYNQVIPEKNIYYYEKPSKNSEIIFTLYAGNKYYIYAPGICQRTESWPTYSKGWRYAKPFLTEEEYNFLVESEGQAGNVLNSEYGYIMLSDIIELVFKSAYDSPLLSDYTSLWSRMSWYFEDRLLPGLYGFDWIFLENGIYISPDLYLSYWRPTEKILGIMILLSGSGAACCRFFSLRKNSS